MADNNKNTFMETIGILQDSGIESSLVDYYIKKIRYFSPLFADNTPAIYDEEIMKLIGFMNISIMDYIVLYNCISKNFLKGNLIIGHQEYPYNLNLSFIILLKGMAHDLITLRNLIAKGFDPQFHSISRNFIEKSKILCLCLYDKEFFENFTKYVNISDEDLYNNFTKEAELNKRLSKIAKEHKQKAPHSLAIILKNKTINKGVRNLGNPFVHMNNFSQIMGYFIEDRKKINLSILHNKTPDSIFRYKYVCEASLLIWSSVITSINYCDYKGEDLDRVELAWSQIYKVYIDHFYTK